MQNPGFQYDATGNRIGATFGAASYTNTINAQSNRFDASTGPLPAKSNKYDEAGNLTSDGSISYTYGPRGRMSMATIGSTAVKYTYNGIGQRISKEGPGALVQTGRHQYMYDSAGHMVGEYYVLGNVLQETVYLGDQPVAVLKQSVTAPANVTDTQVYYVYADQIDTPRVITRALDNMMVWRWDATDPFGLQPPNEKPATAGVFTYNPRFPGQLYDVETNLHYNYFRSYDPQTGRYVESDPIGLVGGANTYAYVGGNPMSYIDPRGEDLVPALVTVGVTAYAINKIIKGRREAKEFACKLKRAQNNIERYGDLVGKMMTPQGLSPFENEMVGYLEGQIQKDRINLGIEGIKQANNMISPVGGVGQIVKSGITVGNGVVVTGQIYAPIANGQCGCDD